MARFKVINKVKTNVGYDTLNPMTPWQVQRCTQLATTSAAKFDLQTDMPVDNLDTVYMAIFYSTFNNSANATVTVNGGQPINIQSNNSNISANQIIAADWVILLIDTSAPLAYLVSTGYSNYAEAAGVANSVDWANVKNKPTYTASRALVTDASGSTSVSATTSTQIGYLSTTTSSIQEQLNAKAATNSPTFTGAAKVTSNTDYATPQLRNVYFATAAPTTLANGDICMVYEV